MSKYTGRTIDFSHFRDRILRDHLSTQGRRAWPHYGVAMNVRLWI